jgi:hypothetical protein
MLRGDAPGRLNKPLHLLGFHICSPLLWLARRELTLSMGI